MIHTTGKYHWTKRLKQKNEFYTLVGSVSAMIADFSPKDLRSIKVKNV